MQDEIAQRLYDNIREHFGPDEWQKKEKERAGVTFIENRQFIRLTEFGHQFVEACIPFDE